jgi:hypothetical protein
MQRVPNTARRLGNSEPNRRAKLRHTETVLDVVVGIVATRSAPSPGCVRSSTWSPLSTRTVCSSLGRRSRVVAELPLGSNVPVLVDAEPPGARGLTREARHATPGIKTSRGIGGGRHGMGLAGHDHLIRHSLPRMTAA